MGEPASLTSSAIARLLVPWYLICTALCSAYTMTLLSYPALYIKHEETPRCCCNSSIREPGPPNLSLSVCACVCPFLFPCCTSQVHPWSCERMRHIWVSFPSFCSRKGHPIWLKAYSITKGVVFLLFLLRVFFSWWREVLFCFQKRQVLNKDKWQHQMHHGSPRTSDMLLWMPPNHYLILILEL